MKALQRLAFVSLFAACSIWSCTPEAPSVETLSFERWEPSFVVDGAALGSRFISFVETAEISLDLAVSGLDEPTTIAALIASHQRGVAVRVVTDADSASQAGFVALRAAGVEVVEGNGPVGWSSSPGTIVARPGSDNRMTHNFAVADQRRVLTSSAAPELADLGGRHLVTVFDSADTAKDFGAVFTQMWGGVFATTQTRFGSTVSADTNNRTRIPMADGTISSVWFGPQENPVKEIIDRVYGAQASVLIAAEALTNAELFQALRYKAEAGFEVRIVVDSTGADGPRSRVAELEAVFEPLAARGEPVSIARVPSLGFNAAIFDSSPSPIDDRAYDATMMVLSHGLVETLPYENTPSGPVSVAAVTFFDAHAWALAEQGSRQSTVLREVAGWILVSSR